jgi:hypothetical protein
MMRTHLILALAACGAIHAQEITHYTVYRTTALPEGTEWVETAIRTTPWRTYTRYAGFREGIEVEAADAVVVARPDGSIDHCIVPLLPETIEGIHPLAHADKPVWLVRDGQWVAAERRDVYRPHPLYRMRFWHDASGRILDSLDLIRRLDTAVSAFIFAPDPLSVANVAYGGIYVDANDGNISVLDSLRTFASVELTWNGVGFVLSNSAAIIQEFDPPSVNVPVLTGPDAKFSRSDSEFEMINVLYHIYEWKQRMASLGYGGMVNYAIPVDVNAYGGADQSAFDFGTSPPRLYFGEGGVDDAEDADVVVHEYGHAMAYGAAPGTNIGVQRQALEESICDYWAVSWSRIQSPYRWPLVFTWDGHNEFWSGRSAVNSQQKMYPGLTFTGPYSHTSVMVDALVRGRQRVGASIMDGLVMEALYSLTSSTTFKQFAEAVLHADTVKYGGVHAAGLHTDFAAWQILTPGLSLDEPSGNSRGTVVLRPGQWPADLAPKINAVDASGRQWILTSGAELPPTGWYWTGTDRFLVIP